MVKGKNSYDPPREGGLEIRRSPQKEKKRITWETTERDWRIINGGGGNCAGGVS